MAGNKTYCIIGLLGIGLGLIATACAGKEEERALSCALDFANDYFNLRFEEAYKHCTAGSRPWIAFRASNITEKDLEAVRMAEEEAYVSATSYEPVDDSTAWVRCTVCQFLAADSLEQSKGRIVPEATFLIPLRKEGHRWSVRMEGPLQNVE